MIARPVTPVELGAMLGLRRAQWLKLALAEEIVELVESGVRVCDLAFWIDDGLVEVYARDELEAEAGVGGTYVMEARLPGDVPGARCVTCGRPFAGARPWCSTPCRRLLRNEGRRLFPDQLDDDALRAAVRWAVRERNTRLGWAVPLTRAVAERLYYRGDPPGGTARPNGTR